MSHVHENSRKAIGATYLSILGNGCLAVIKFATGYFGNSYALIADAIESTSDIFSSLLVLFGLKVSSKPADENHPYGHGKAEPLMTFIVVGFLVGSAAIISYQSIVNIRTPHESPRGYTLLVLGLIIVFKEAFYRVIEKKGQETNSTALKADAWHHRSDALTSLAAFIGISVSLLLGPGYAEADDWAALVASGFILFNAYLIFRPALGEIMDEHLHDDMVVKIRRIASGVDGVINTEKCYVRKTGLTYHVDLHVIVDGEMPVKKGHYISHVLKDTLQKELPEIANVITHIEPDKFYEEKK